MVKFFKKVQSPNTPKKESKGKGVDLKEYLFFVYVQWSKEDRVLKTYIKTMQNKNEIVMVCNGLSDLVANPEMNMNSKNIKMIVMYQVDDDHDVSKDFDVQGVIPTRLDHYLNSDPSRWRLKKMYRRSSLYLNSTGPGSNRLSSTCSVTLSILSRKEA